MKPLLAFFPLLVLAAAVQAQAYRCTVDGRTVFQQAPCTGGSKVAPGTAASTGAATQPTGAALCEQHARSAAVFTDPESLRIGRIAYIGARKLVIHDATIAARTYSLAINARTEFGGYGGEALYECQLSEDEARVLKFARALVPQRQPPANAR